MDAKQFDHLTQALAPVTSRRAAFMAILAGVFTVVDDAAGRHRQTRRRRRRDDRRDRVRQQRKKKKCAKAGQALSKKRKKCCKDLLQDPSGLCNPPSPPSPPPPPPPPPSPGCEVCASGCRYATMRVAVEDPAGPSTIRVCAGAYPGRIDIARSVTIIGAGAASTTVDGGGADFDFIIQAGVTVALQGLRITGGASPAGGGILNRGSTSVTDCVITGNKADVGAGVHNIIGATLTMTNCTVSANETTPDDGGGIRNEGEMTLTNCLITGNQARSGAGLYNTDSATATLNGTTVTRNTAAEQGGGIFNDAGDPSPLNLHNGASVTGNHAGTDGGGIYNIGDVNCDGTSTVTGNTVGAGVLNNCINGVDGEGCDTCPA